jgi:hypothetical protein
MVSAKGAGTPRPGKKKVLGEHVEYSIRELYITLSPAKKIVRVPGPSLIDMVVCVFSVGRRPAMPETYQSASGRPTRGGFTLLERIYVEIFGGRKFRESFEAQNPHNEIFPQFSI